MKTKNNKPLNVAIYGMDERSHKMMEMFLKGPCKGIAVVVDELGAELDIIDADSVNAKEILDNRKVKTPDRPIILLSLEEVIIDGTIYVKKPVQTDELVEALKKVKLMLGGDKLKKVKDLPKQLSSPESKPEPEPKKEKRPFVVENKQTETKKIDSKKSKKRAKHRTTVNLTEKGFSAYIGHVDGVDFSDQEQVLLASFSPKNFFLGYVQSAIRVARDKGRILQLNSSWKPLIIFPHSQEIWLDADDKQLRAFAGLAIANKSGQGMSLSSVEQNTSEFINEKIESFYDADAFIWRLAVWTSKGRYPEAINIDRPVYLKHWPNFTRLVVTPHALQITALLINGPRTLINIADSLKIKPQYVFVFISAAYAVGIVGQARRKADELIVPPEVKKPASKGLLSKILSRLRS